MKKKFLSACFLSLLLLAPACNKVQTYKITVNNGTGSGTYDSGATVSITATIPDYKLFDYWESDGVKVSTENPYTFSVTKDATYSAMFKDEKGTLTVVNGTGSGTYSLNTSVTVTAEPEATQTFKHWEINGVNVSTANPYTFTLLEDTTIVAVFNEDPMAKYTKTMKMKGDKFKILNFTDIQLHDGDTLDLTYHVIDTLVEQEKPDLITLLGDHINDSKDYDVTENQKALVKHIDSLGIPWAPIFGNHDNIEYHPSWSKKSVGVDFLMGLYDDCENCMFTQGPSDVQGKSNYMINVVDSDDELVESLIFLDSKTEGLDATNVDFYEDCVLYAKALNDGVTVPSVVFDHIPINEYMTAFETSEDNECRDLVGIPGIDPLVAGQGKMFDKMKELGSTKTIVCGHDHEDMYYNVYDGITLAHAMKSSDGDDKDGITYRHPVGGFVINVDGVNDDELIYTPVTDITASLPFEGSTDFPYYPNVLPYWQYSGASLEFDIDLPDNGSIKFNLEGSNLQRTSVPYEKRVASWNRLTKNIIISASDKSATKGTLTLLKGNKYHYSLDLMDAELNKDGGEVACGDETLRLIYFHSIDGKYGITNIHYEFEEVKETTQLDLANATLTPASIEDQTYNGVPVKPEVTVTLGGETLKKVDDILFTYKNNNEAGVATLTVVPSGKGAHKYKGSISLTFNILENPMRGEVFEKGYTHNFDDMMLATDTLVFDVHFTSTGDNTMKFMLGDGWDSLFGYYGLKNDGTLEDNYSGITVQPTVDDYYRVTCVLSKLNKQNGSTPLPTTKVNLFYIHNSWGNSPKGYIDFEMIDPPETIRGETFSHAGKTITFQKLTYSDTIIVDFKFTSGNATGVSFMVGNSGNGWANYFGYYKLYASGTLGDNYGGITVSKTADGYFRLTIVLGELSKPSADGGPSKEAGFNLFYIHDGWTDASGYVDFNPSVK